MALEAGLAETSLISVCRTRSFETWRQEAGEVREAGGYKRRQKTRESSSSKMSIKSPTRTGEEVISFSHHRITSSQPAS